MHHTAVTARAEQAEACAGNAGHGRGRILRLKQGYNPNSSSMGSIVFVLPVALGGITLGFGLASSIILAFFLKKNGDEGRHASSPDRDVIRPAD